ncbi:hypothetical protein SESBI_50528 [Sesbania bispinosa]|nr:hypothetical protein SESBI_50528 [Sesbania bispinosa]
MSLAIEDMVPHGKAKKAMWARGLDMLGYSLNSLRLTNLKFNDTKTTRFSQVVRLQLNQNDTKGVLAVSPLLYIFGFYHSAILNSHEIKEGDTLWELAKRTYGAFANSKECNKHFLDMANLNFLMCKAIENPGLTQSSSLRTTIISVFEDTVVDNSIKKQREVGVEDYMGCASVHGVGPSIAIFDTVRDGSLDYVCVYPAPLHSREQMQELVSKMKVILIEGAKTYE